MCRKKASLIFMLVILLCSPLIVGTWVAQAQVSFERRDFAAGPYKCLDQVGGPGNTFTLYYDGRQGWEILPDQRVLPLVGGELRFAEKYLRNFQLTTLLADRDPDYTITSPAANVIRIADKKSASHDLEITLDPASWLPIKNTSVSLADPAHPVPSETRFEEWEVVHGVRFARQASILRGGVRLARFTLERLELNRGLDVKDLARKPADLKPELESSK
jgi:hypothetical protein